MTTEDRLKDCYDIALNSPDPSTKNGAIVVSNETGENVSFGFNHIPMDPHKIKPEWLTDKSEKYARVVHAEVHAVLGAMYSRGRLEKYTLYCAWAACLSCANVIYLSGIKKVISHRHPKMESHPTWDTSIQKSRDFFKANGVEFIEVPVVLNKRVLFNGEWIDV